MEKDPIIFDHTGKPVKKEKENSDESLPAGVQALIESRINFALDQFRELIRRDLKELARKTKKPWQAISAFWFVLAIIMTFMMWRYTPKWIEDKVDEKLTVPAIEESADRIIESKVTAFIDDKMKPLNEQAEVLGNKITKALQEIQNVQGTLDYMRKYGEIARINFRGDIMIGSTGSSTSLYGWNGDFVKLHKNYKEGTYQIKGDEMCTSAALDQYRSVIKKHPYWPFSHSILAICLKRQGDKSWENHAKRALEIFEKTTAVPNHDPDHSRIMHIVKLLL